MALKKECLNASTDALGRGLDRPAVINEQMLTAPHLCFHMNHYHNG